MTITQIPGSVQLRRHQFGIQSALNTAVAATRRVPWTGPIEINPNWTNPDVDLGSLDPIAQPFIADFSVSANLESNVVYYNDYPLRWGAGLKGGVSPSLSSGAYTWDFQIASLTPDVFDVFSDEWGDDTEATDGIIGVGGVIDVLEESFSPDLGPWQISDQWLYSDGLVGQNLTDSLTPDSNGVPVMADETQVKMDTAPGSIGITIVDQGVHAVTQRITNNLDRKRFANGSNSANQLSGYSRGERMIELILTVPKTTNWVAEANTLKTRPRPAKYFEVMTRSTTTAGSGSTKYEVRRRGAYRLFERADVEVNGNAAIQLTYRAFYDSTLGYAFHGRVVNTQATVVAP